MTPSAEICRDEERRHRVRRLALAEGRRLNGLDYLEVGPDQRVLFVYFLGGVPEGLRPVNVRIEGGRRVREVRAVDVRVREASEPDEESALRVEVDRPGDFSTYTFRLVEPDLRGEPGDVPLKGLDPRYAHLEFTFKIDCPSDLDCRPTTNCPPPPRNEPVIDYLAKDYASFRRLILDRLALIMPGWTERHVPDLGITLVELLAYVGDDLSYYQDAVATEAYLETARLRRSVRRHVRLVDYPMHDGCNARAWVFLRVEGVEGARIRLANHAFLSVSGEVFEPMTETVVLRESHNAIAFYTWGDRQCCLPQGATSATLWLRPPPEAAGTAPPQLVRPAPSLKIGDVLLFEEVKGPRTGAEADADPAHRHVVRLTRVTPLTDPLDGQPVVEVEWGAEDALPFPLCISAIGRPPECPPLEDVSLARGNLVLVDHGRTVTEPIRAPIAPEPRVECRAIGEPITVRPPAELFRPDLSSTPLTCRAPFPDPSDVAARQAAVLETLVGRVRARIAEYAHRVHETTTALQDSELEELRTIVGTQALADVGLPLPPRRPATPAEQARAIDRLIDQEGKLFARKVHRVNNLLRHTRSGLMLSEAHVRELAGYFGQPFVAGLGPQGDELLGPASTALVQDPRIALPALVVRQGDEGSPAWHPVRDLLRSGPRDRHVVAEPDNQGRVTLRFGDGTSGRGPTPGKPLVARYRVGNGIAGHVGAELITRLEPAVPGIVQVRNPLPARGGVDPEPLAAVKRFAPGAFRGERLRAVTADDYARLAERHPGVQRAAAELRWNGSGFVARVAIDPTGQAEATARLLAEVHAILAPFRRIGHDLAVVPARYVSLEIGLDVCVRPHALRGHVAADLRATLGSHVRPDGRRGLFHPDRLSFGQSIHLSRLIAAAQAVAGVSSVAVTALNRRFEHPRREIEAGVLPIGPLEIARMDSDPSFPENGALTLTLRGGR
jgi:predicted phage baseplate assembly protein